MHLSFKRGCMTVKATDELACSAQSGAQITLQALCCSRKCLLRVDCLYFPIPEEDYSISWWTIARDFGTGTLPRGALWGCLVWVWVCEAGVDFVWPERKYSLSHGQVKQASIGILYLLLPHRNTCSFLHQEFFTVHSCLSAAQGKDDFVGFSASLAGKPWF